MPLFRKAGTPPAVTWLSRGGALVVLFAALLPHHAHCQSGSAPTVAGADDPLLQCNGYVEYCDQPMDQLTFAMTHNSYAASDQGYNVAFNHIKWIEKQLEAGIRSFMLDIWIDEDGDASLCHAECVTGKDGLDREARRHVGALRVVEAFLAANPHEVVVITYEDYTYNGEFYLRDYTAANLIQYTYVHGSIRGEGDAEEQGSGGTAPWPTLREMIASGQRLLVMADVNYNRAWVHSIAPWMHYNKDLHWETNYENYYMSDFDCRVHRGRRGPNKLVVVNHFRNSALSGLPVYEKADRSNKHDAVVKHALQCNVTVEPPARANFMAVDFWSIGEVLEAVETINFVFMGLRNTTVDPWDSSGDSWWAEVWEEVQHSLWLQLAAVVIISVILVGCCFLCNFLWIISLEEEYVKQQVDEKVCTYCGPSCQKWFHRIEEARYRRRNRIWKWMHEDHCHCFDVVHERIEKIDSKLAETTHIKILPKKRKACTLCGGCCGCWILCCCWLNPVFRRKNPQFYKKGSAGYHRTSRIGFGGNVLNSGKNQVAPATDEEAPAATPEADPMAAPPAVQADSNGEILPAVSG